MRSLAQNFGGKNLVFSRGIVIGPCAFNMFRDTSGTRISLREATRWGRSHISTGGGQNFRASVSSPLHHHHPHPPRPHDPPQRLNTVRLRRFVLRRSSSVSEIASRGRDPNPPRGLCHTGCVTRCVNLPCKSRRPVREGHSGSPLQGLFVSSVVHTGNGCPARPSFVQYQQFLAKMLFHTGCVTHLSPCAMQIASQ